MFTQISQMLLLSHIDACCFFTGKPSAGSGGGWGTRPDLEIFNEKERLDVLSAAFQSCLFTFYREKTC